MIHIICGENNQGKTTKIKSIYAEETKGDGFITQKIFRDSIFCGYKITRLSTGESVTLSLKTELFPLVDNSLYTNGSFSFYEGGFDFADSVIDDIISRQISPVFIDEIGPLELKGKGVHDSFKKLLETGTDIFFTVRNHLLERTVSQYGIKNYSLIRL